MSHKLTKNIPLLRFPEFSGEWEIKNLSDIATKQTKKNDDNSISRVLTNSATKGIIDQQDYFDKDIANADNLTGYYVIDKGDYVYNPRISANAPVGPINKNKIGLGVMSPLYTVFRFNNQENTFYEQYFKTSFWHKYMCSIANYGARHDRMNITTSDFMNLPLPFPSLQEQEKIAKFLTTIDKKITLLRQKLELLQTYKRGVMQQIFSQEIRFKNDDGSNFPDWEVKKLEDVGLILNGLTGKTAEDFGEGKLYITYKQVFDSSYIQLEKCQKVFIKENEKQNMIIAGDILFTASSETPNEVGFASVLLDNVDELYLNSFCFALRIKNQQLIPAFSKYLFRSHIYRKKVFILAQGSTRYNISKKEFKKIQLFIPTIQEQEKIANFLTAIDQKIEAVGKQIEGMEKIKKGLLQQMFI